MESRNDAANKYVLLKVAKDVAAQAADVETAFSVVDVIAQEFEVDPIGSKADLLTVVAKQASLASEHAGVARRSLALIDQAVAGDNYDLALRLGKLALAEARRARGPQLVRQIEDQIAQTGNKAGPMTR